MSDDLLQVAPAGALVGELSVPGDKSISHRAVMVGALSDDRVTVTGFGASADTLATVDAFRAVGVSIERINRWAQSLEAKKLVIVPVSAARGFRSPKSTGSIPTGSIKSTGSLQ